jgi:hypothetical protein
MQTKIYVDPIMWAEVMHMVMVSDVEISFMCDLKYVNGLPYVYQWHLPEQVNTAVTTEMSAESVGAIPIPTGGYTNVWIHSHVNMTAFWSGTDADTSEQLGKHGFMYSIVVNKRHESLCCYNQGGDGFFPPMYRDDIPIVIGSPVAEERGKVLAELVDTNCKAPAKPTFLDADKLNKKELKQVRKGLDYPISNIAIQNDWEVFLTYWGVDSSSNSTYKRDAVLDEFHEELLRDNDFTKTVPQLFKPGAKHPYQGEY